MWFFPGNLHKMHKIREDKGSKSDWCLASPMEELSIDQCKPTAEVRLLLCFKEVALIHFSNTGTHWCNLWKNGQSKRYLNIICVFFRTILKSEDITSLIRKFTLLPNAKLSNCVICIISLTFLSFFNLLVHKHVYYWMWIKRLKDSGKKKPIQAHLHILEKQCFSFKFNLFIVIILAYS